MQKSWIHYLKEILVTQMNHWILVMAALTILSVFSADNLHLGFLLLLGLIPVYDYYLRLNAKRYVFFILLHLVPFLILPLCKGSLVLMLVTGSILIFYLVYSIKTKISPLNVENPFIGPAADVCCIAVCYFFYTKYGKADIGNYYMIAFFVFLLVYFLYYFVNNYVWFIMVQKNSVDNISEQSLWIGGLKQLLLFMGIAAVCMLSLMNFEWLSFVVSKIGAFLVWILRGIISLLRIKEPTESFVYDQSSQRSTDGGFLNMGHSGTSPFWIFLEKMAVIATVLFLLWLIIKGLQKFFRYLRTSFYQSKKSKTTLSFNGTDVREQCEIIETENYFKKLFTPRSPRDNARRVYKKFIIKHKQDLIGDLDKEHLSPLTAGECCDSLHCPEVHALYNKVRYSDEKISAADVKALKEKTKL